MNPIKNIIGAFFQARRTEKGLTTDQLLLLIRPNPTPRQAISLNQRIRNLEEACHARPWLWQQVARIFGVDDATFNQLVEEERVFQQEETARRQAEFDAWAAVPVRPYGVMRLMSAVYAEISIPVGATQEEAERIVSEKARETRHQCCLVWNRRWSIFFRENGTLWHRRESGPTRNYTPFMVVGNRRCLLREIELPDMGHQR